MNKLKIINDPVYGFISIPNVLVFDLLEHRYFQRLRRIKQLGMTHYVYPGAHHTRFHHALGAVHLAMQAVQVLRSKGVGVSEEEAEALSVAVLLHDIGHGPFSHALEHTLVNVHHEELSLRFMERINAEMHGRLAMAMAIFQGRHPKPFLHQLVSSQLDMDRMDYLSRDSFFTGVHEGVIGYSRLIKMLSVHDGQLVVEEKGIYSVEKFLIARRLMYWQVYLHKTVLAAEQMLIKTLQRAKHLAREGERFGIGADLRLFLENDYGPADFEALGLLEHFARLDDCDIVQALKVFAQHEDRVLGLLADSLLARRLFRVRLSERPFEAAEVAGLRQSILEKMQVPQAMLPYLFIEGQEATHTYDTQHEEISILFKDGAVKPMSQVIEFGMDSKKLVKHYICYPKQADGALF